MIGVVRITICGHASVLIEAGSTVLLVDPLFTDRFASGAIGFEPPRRFELDNLPMPTALLVTHHHLDHWHAPTICRFDRSTPVVIPPDTWLGGRLEELGFVDVRPVEPWSTVRVGDLRLLITPSAAELDEIGFVALDEKASYWHMSDTLVDRSVGVQVRQRVGPVTAVAARYLGGEALIAYQRGLGTAHDERDTLVELLEAACAADPSFVFPYFAGFCFLDEHAWANRWAKPYAPADIVALLRQRVGDRARVEELRPGDRLLLGNSSTGAEREAEVEWGSAPFVSAEPSQPSTWEPVDVHSLAGLDDPADIRELKERLEGWFRRDFSPWLQAELLTDGSPWQALADWAVIWSCVVHCGSGQRLEYRADFRQQPARFTAGPSPDATYTVHLSGRSLLRVLRGDAGAELLWMAGDARFCERVIGVRDGQVWAPPVRGWDLYEAVPEPLTFCLRRVGVTPR
jgi:glyoxylase-like metal-dependent hydrolase (beta-lactamase superfamily II)